MKHQLHSFLVVLCIAIFGASCSNPLSEEVDEVESVPVSFRVNTIDMKNFGSKLSRADVKSVISRLDFAIFNESGTKVGLINQVTKSKDFAAPQRKYKPGNYILVVVGHSNLNSTRIPQLDKVFFQDNKVTDTFYKKLRFTVGLEPSEVDINLERVVSMIRFVFKDNQFHKDLDHVSFTYDGGSTVFNPTTGFGGEDSQQTVTMKLSEATRDNAGHTVFELYTFPQSATDELNMVVTPMDATGNNLAKPLQINKLPVQVNYVTECSGLLFEGGSSSFKITVDDVWKGTIPYEIK